MVAELDIPPVREEPPHSTDRRRWWMALSMALAVATTAALVWFGSGLTPVPWLTWLAPIPMFWLATRVTGRAAALGGFGAWVAGSLNVWTYYRGTLEVPVPVVAGFLLLQALAFAGTVAIFGSLIRRGRPVLAVLAAPAVWAGIDYLTSLFSPGGSFTSLAYTQAEFLPVVQLTSATGVWGVSFVLMAAPVVTVAAVCVRASWRRLTVLGAVLFVLVAGYGVWRLQGTQDGPSATVALAAVVQSTDSLPIASPEAQRVLDAYLRQVPEAAAAGAGVIVMPEKVFKVSEAEHADLGRRLTALAAANRITIVIGLTLRDATGAHNIAMAYSADGAVRYDKQHLVTGWEDHFTPGHELATLPGSTLALAICKDLDHVDPSRGYAQRGTTMLLVPALDFDRDGWLHSRIAVVRGVENGMTVVRAARRGLLTVSDPSGRVLTDAGSDVMLTTAAVRSGADPTLYTRFGDWFAWLCLALAAWGAISLIRARRRVIRPVS